MTNVAKLGFICYFYLMEFKGKQKAIWVATPARVPAGACAVLGGSKMNLISTATQAWLEDGLPMFATVRIEGGETRSIAMVFGVPDGGYQIKPIQGFEEFGEPALVSTPKIAEGLLDAFASAYADKAQANAEDWQGSMSQLTRRFNRLDVV